MIETVRIPAAGQTLSMEEVNYASPVHDVILSKNFRMSKYQVTNAQYAAFLNAKGIGSGGSDSNIGSGQKLISASSSNND